MSGCRWPTLCSLERRVERSKEKRATVRSSRHGEGQVTATSIPRMTLGSCSLATVQPTRFALVCVRVFSVYQVHGQVWTSCQTERLGILGAGNAHFCGPRCGTLLPRSASRLAPRPLRLNVTLTVNEQYVSITVGLTPRKVLAYARIRKTVLRTPALTTHAQHAGSHTTVHAESLTKHPGARTPLASFNFDDCSLRSFKEQLLRCYGPYM